MEETVQNILYKVRCLNVKKVQIGNNSELHLNFLWHLPKHYNLQNLA